MDQCPVIHRVSDHDASSIPSDATCPVTGMKMVDLNINTDSISDVPSLEEYKQLRNVMAMITRFYRDGSEAKKANYDSMTEELGKLEADEKMILAQLAALDTQPAFKHHPKQKDYRRDLNAEMEAMTKQKEQFLAKQKDFKELHEWSLTIVKVCEWLELVLDDYCAKNLDLPQKMKDKMKPVPELTEEEAKKYFKGLDEITYNLSESQDFFQASVDGRLNRYHDVERRIIETQIAALQQFPEDSPRRMYVEGELQKDLEYVKNNMKESPEALRRREKMLKNHAEFCKVLKYYKDKLKVLGYVDDGQERKYDTRFDHYRED